MKIELIRAANDIAKLLIAQANGQAALSDELLAALGNAEQAGLDLNTVWASIAETNGWKDRDAGIDGNPMPKTLANYRSLSRKALEHGVTHIGVKYPEWRKAISAAAKANASEDEAPKIESINLNNAELPDWIERASNLRAGMDMENLKAFDSYLHHHIEAFMNKKVKK